MGAALLKKPDTVKEVLMQNYYITVNEYFLRLRYSISLNHNFKNKINIFIHFPILDD
jgi:hypothetical protein